jgi:imidazolonepropionase-like amidohydrolase
MQLTADSPKETRPSLLPKLAVKPWIQKPPRKLVLRNVWVVNPASGTLLESKRWTVTTAGGIFSSMQPGDDSFQTDVKKGIENDGTVVVDLTDKFICPGLIDCHVHVTATPGVKTVSDLVRTPDELTTLRCTYVLKEMIRRGFTTARDTGGASKLIAESIEEGLLEGPRLFQCGKALSQTGGHGDFSSAKSGGSDTGCCGGHAQSVGRTADGVPQVLKATREELKAGADFIKIMVGGGVASETDAIETVQFTAEEIRAITTTCRQMGKKHTTAHAYTVDAVNHAIDNGVKGIEHGNLIDKATAQKMASKGIYLTPTLSCYGIMVRPPFEDFLPESGKLKNAEVMKQGLEALKIAHDAGVTICYGSDLLTSMHALQTEEFVARASILSSADVLRHATTNAAKMLGLPNKLGVISVGAHADFLILNKNPLEDVTILDRPEEHLEAVVKAGRVVSSALVGLNAAT